MKLFLLIFIPCFIFCSAQAFAYDAKIVLLRGKVLVNGKATTEKMKLFYGDRVESVGKKSFAQILFKSSSKLMVKNGAIVLEKLKSSGTLIKLIRGTIFSFVNKKAKKDFIVKTGSASLGVRGTKFLAMYENKETYLCVCEGSVRISNKTGKIDVLKNQDIHVSENSTLKTSKINEAMFNMSRDGFGEMGMPLN